MTNTLIFIWIVVLLLGGTAVAGLLWAIASGQFAKLNETANSIFDEDESIGQTTDAFPRDDD